MFKKYDDTLLLNIEPIAIVRSYNTTQKSEIIEQIEVSANPINPMQLVKEALQREISNMKKFNAKLDQQYSSLLNYVK